MIFTSQTVLGIWGNFSLLSHYVFLHFTRYRLKFTDVIIRNILVANSLVILTKGIPNSVTAFGVWYFLNDFACKLVFYLHKVGRDMSIFSTCLLSVFQAILINSRSSSRWVELKGKTPKYIEFSMVFGWIFYFLINALIPVNMIGKWSNTNTTKRIDLVYCSSSQILDKILASLYSTLVQCSDVICLLLMLWASSSSVFILYRHKQRVKHIHRNSVSPRSSPESKATKSILVLASTFITLYAISTVLQIYVFFGNHLGWMLVNLSMLISACFPTVSPFLLMSHGSSVSILCFSWVRKENVLLL